MTLITLIISAGFFLASLVQSPLSFKVLKDLGNLVAKLTTAADNVAAIPSIQRLADATDFLTDFGPRSREEHHLSFADEVVSIKAGEARDCLAAARVVIAALTNDIAAEIQNDATVAEAQRLTKCLVDVRKSAALFEGLYTKYEKQIAFKAAMDQATAALETLTLGAVKTARSQFASTTQRQFWSAETKDEVDAAVDAITTKLAEFDIHRLLADHDKVVAEEETRRQEDEQRRIEQLRQEKDREEQRQIEAAATKQKEREAAKKRECDEAKAAAALKERKQLEKIAKTTFAAKASIETDLAELHADLKVMQRQIINRAEASYMRHAKLYSRFLLGIQIGMLLVIVGLMPNYYRSDQSCSLETLSSYIKPVRDPIIAAETFIVFITLERMIGRLIGKPGPTTALFNSYQLETIYDTVHCLMSYYYIASDVTGFGLFDLVQKGFPSISLCPGNKFHSVATFLQRLLVRLCVHIDGATEAVKIARIERDIKPFVSVTLLIVSVILRVTLVGQIRHSLMDRLKGKKPTLAHALALRTIDRSTISAFKKRIAQYPEQLDRLHGHRMDESTRRQVAMMVVEVSRNVDSRIAKLLETD